MQWEHWRSVVYDRNRWILTERAKSSVSRKVPNVNIRKVKGNILLPLVQYYQQFFIFYAENLSFKVLNTV